MKKWGILLSVLAVVLLQGQFLAAEEDIQKHPTCKYCGMDRQMFALSRMLVEYEDGPAVGVCSIHCAAVALVMNADKMPKAIRVGDFNSKELIEADKAFWVVGGSKPGVMTQRAKWAFQKQKDAEKFRADYGGEPANFDQAMKASFEDIYSDLKMMWGKRRKMMGQ
jgi:copper chaperone NosL